MSEPVIFKDLPATFPERDGYKKPSVISSVIFHVVLIAVLILIPLLLPETISQRQLLLTLVAPPPPPPPKVVAPAEPIRVGGDVREPRVVRLVPPVYPSLASRARVTGTVILEAILTEDGTVDQIRVISGHPLLIDAAVNCVKRWRYEPTLLNGVPVRVVLTAKVHFDRPIS